MSVYLPILMKIRKTRVRLPWDSIAPVFQLIIIAQGALLAVDHEKCTNHKDK